MMTDGKETLTYVRKKPPILIAYKRKRLLPRKDFNQQDECPGMFHAPTTEEKKEELSEGNETELSKKDTKHAPEEAVNKLLFIKQKGHLASAEESSKEDNKNEKLHDKELAAESLSVLDESPENNISQKVSEDQLFPSSHELQESNRVQEISCSFLNSSSSEENSTVTCSFPLPASCSTMVDTDSSSLKTSNTSEYTVSWASEKFCLKETGSSVEDKSSSFCMKAVNKRKLSSPLITFHRRCKRKKDMNVLHVQNALDADVDGTLGSTTVASLKQATHAERDSENASTARKNVESSYAGDRSSSESGSFTQPDHKMENIMREDTPTVEIHPQITEVNVSHDSPEGCSGKSSNDASVDPALEPALFSNDSSTGKSEIFSIGLNAEKVTLEIPCARGSSKAIDLSIPAQVPDSGVASVCYENSLGNSLEAPSGTLTIPLNGESRGIKDLEMVSLHENIGKNHSSHQLLGNGYTPEKAAGCEHNFFAYSSPANTLRSGYLQLFPEQSACDTSPSTKMHQKSAPSSGSKGRMVDLLENSCQAGTAEVNSSLLRLSLPMELINNSQNGSFPSTRPNSGGIQSREIFINTVPQGFPVKPSTSTRHKMMLDNIVNKTRTPQQNRSSGMHFYGHPTLWTEEELDCLWKGFRRYGKGNWEIMLKDPRLDFSPWRNAWDLAQQWEAEEAKFLSSMFSSQGRPFRVPRGLQDGIDGFRHPIVRRPNSVADVQLSLGDVYSKPNDSGLKKSLPNIMDIQNNAPMQHLGTNTRKRALSSYIRNHRRSSFLHDRTQNIDSSVLADCSAYVPSAKDFPHWLKELVATPLKPPQVLALSDISAVGPVEVHRAGIGIDQQWNQLNNKNTVLGGRELQVGAEAQNKTFPAVQGIANKQEQQHPADNGDVIVIDSDASSEETISDNVGAVV